MRCHELYLDDVTECQGDLFALAVRENYDLVEFIRHYLSSELRSLIDRGYALFCTMSGAELMEESIKRGMHVKKVKERQYDEFMAEWIGAFYSLLQWSCNISSEETLRIAEPKEVIQRYGVLHDLDMQLAVKKWREGRGI